jgi:hypothetical protein
MRLDMDEAARLQDALLAWELVLLKSARHKLLESAEVRKEMYARHYRAAYGLPARLNALVAREE